MLNKMGDHFGSLRSTEKQLLSSSRVIWQGVNEVKYYILLTVLIVMSPLNIPTSLEHLVVMMLHAVI